MRIGVAVDASADVPPELVKAPGFLVMPYALKSDADKTHIERAPGTTGTFYSQKLNEREDIRAEALSVQEMGDFLSRTAVVNYDYLFLITISGTRSNAHANALKAAARLTKTSPGVRAARGNTSPFAMHVVDSQSVFTGPALLAWEVMRMARLGETPAAIRKRLNELAADVETYVLPKKIPQASIEKLRGHQERSVGPLGAWVMKALDLKPLARMRRGHTRIVAIKRGHDRACENLFATLAKRLEAPLSLSTVVLSYAGPRENISKLPGFDRLVAATKLRNLQLVVTQMNPAGALHVGEHALSVSLCLKR